MLAAITCFFNPCNWTNRQNNFRMFRDHFKAADLFMIEASFDDTFVFEDSVHVHANEGNRYIWQKERMLNHLEQMVPSQYDKIAWVDADIVFMNPDWAEQAEMMLDEYTSIQLFETADYLNADYAVTTRRASCGSDRSNNINEYHCGFAWAARRSLFPLCDCDIVGGGDAVMLNWWFGELSGYTDRMRSAPLQQSSESEALRHHHEVASRIAAVSGTVKHLYHGTLENRKYRHRSASFAKTGFDPRVHIERDANGLWRWSAHRETGKIRDWCRRYLENREEDT